MVKGEGNFAVLRKFLFPAQRRPGVREPRIVLVLHSRFPPRTILRIFFADFFIPTVPHSSTSKFRALPAEYHECFLMPANSNVSPIAKKITLNSYERRHYHKKSRKYKNKALVYSAGPTRFAVSAPRKKESPPQARSCGITRQEVNKRKVSKWGVILYDWASSLA